MEKDIAQLFQKAANKPVEASFDETKAQFLAGTAPVAVKAKAGKLFTLKKGLIMFTIIGTIGITALLMTNFNKNEIEKGVTDKTTIAEFKTHVESNSLEEDILNDDKNGITLVDTVGEEIVEFFVEKESPVLNLPNLKFKPYRKMNYLPPQIDLGVESMDDEVPVLSKKQIKEHEKRKKKMVKALAKRDKDDYRYIPSSSFTFQGKPISVQAFYMQREEVTNGQYETFLNDLLLQGRTEDYLKARPDETKWEGFVKREELQKGAGYFGNDNYDSYPVVNISREGAEMYCFWLTIETNKYLQEKDEPYINDVRIPVRAEWACAASVAGKYMPFSWGDSIEQATMYNKSTGEKWYVINYEHNPPSKRMLGGYGYKTIPSHFGVPNEFGLKNMNGNVAEMVYEHVTKRDLMMKTDNVGTAGGGWMSTLEYIKIDGPDQHGGLTEGHPNVGFRVVITYLKK